MKAELPIETVIIGETGICDSASITTFEWIGLLVIWIIHVSCFLSLLIGSLTVKVVPTPASLTTTISPRCFWIIQ